MKRTFSFRRKRVIAAFGMAALVALTGSAAALVDLEGSAGGLVSGPGVTGIVGIEAEVEVDDLDDLELGGLLDEHDLLEELNLLDELEVDDLEVEAVVALLVQVAAELGLDLDDLGLDLDDPDLDDLDLDDIDVEAVVAIMLGLASEAGLDIDDVLDVLADLDLGLDDLDLEDVLDGELGPLVEAGNVIIKDTTVSVGDNILRDAEILNDLDIQIGDSDTLDEILGLAGLVPGLGGPGGGHDDGDDEDDEVEGAGTLAPIKPAAAKPAAAKGAAQPAGESPQLVSAATLERPETDVLAAAEVLGDSETSSSRGPLPRTGSSATLAGFAAALLGGSGALSLLLRRRRNEDS